MLFAPLKVIMTAPPPIYLELVVGIVFVTVIEIFSPPALAF